MDTKIQNIIDAELNDFNRFEPYTAIARVTLNGEGQSQTEKLQISGSDFLLERIEIHGYSRRHGNLFGNNNLPLDRFTLQIQDLAKQLNWFSKGLDIARFAPSSVPNKYIKQIVKSKTDLEITISHSRAVWGLDTDANNPAVFGRINGSTDSATGNPVEIEIAFIGYKLSK